MARTVSEEHSGCQSSIHGLWTFFHSTRIVPVQSGKPWDGLVNSAVKTTSKTLIFQIIFWLPPRWKKQVGPRCGKERYSQAICRVGSYEVHKIRKCRRYHFLLFLQSILKIFNLISSIKVCILAVFNRSFICSKFCRNLGSNIFHFTGVAVVDSKSRICGRMECSIWRRASICTLSLLGALC